MLTRGQHLDKFEIIHLKSRQNSLPCYCLQIAHYVPSDPGNPGQGKLGRQ